MKERDIDGNFCELEKKDFKKIIIEVKKELNLDLKFRIVKKKTICVPPGFEPYVKNSIWKITVWQSIGCEKEADDIFSIKKITFKKNVIVAGWEAILELFKRDLIVFFK